MAEKTAASTMPPPSGTRLRKATAVDFAAMRECLQQLGADAQEWSTIADNPGATARAAELTGEAFAWLASFERAWSAVTAPFDSQAVPGVLRPGRAAEAAALGADYVALPDSGDLEKESLGTLLAQTLAPHASDEVIAGGICQVADDLNVLYIALGSAGYVALPLDRAAEAVSVCERRLRVVAAIARKTIGAIEGRVS